MAAIIQSDLYASKMTRQDGCFTTVVVQNEIQIHQQKREKGLPKYAIISNAEQALSIPVSAILQFLEAESLQHAFFHTCLTLSLASLKYENSIVFNSVSRHDDAILEYIDMMS